MSNIETEVPPCREGKHHEILDMSRTYRRITCAYDYPLGLRQLELDFFANTPFARRVRARYHSDAYRGQREPPPRCFRKPVDRMLRQHNRAVLKLWLRSSEHLLVFNDGRRCPDWWPA